jgi:hypothetical protein
MPAPALPRRARGRARWLLPSGLRKALLAVHVIVAAGWIGLDVCLLVLAVTGEVEKKGVIPFAVRMSRSVDGVVNVTDQLTLAVHGTRLPVP